MHLVWMSIFLGMRNVPYIETESALDYVCEHFLPDGIKIIIITSTLLVNPLIPQY